MMVKRSVLITGCSEGGMGSALAIAFQKADYYVYATARCPEKMKHLAALGIETISLDVESEQSIKSCVNSIDSLDVLVNNAGATMAMPVVDLDIEKAKRLFDLNVWLHITVIQALMPLLLQSSDSMIVNHTSSASLITIPWSGAYSASKAAMAMLSDTLRLELQPFNIKVVDLKTALVKTNILQNFRASQESKLPETSIYWPAKEAVERNLRQEDFEPGITAEAFAEGVVQDLTRKHPPANIWRGKQALLARISTLLPHGLFDGKIKSMTGLDVVERALLQ